MEDWLDSLGPLGTILVIVGAITANYLYLALLHKIRGPKYRKDKKTQHSIRFSTNTGDYRLDKQHDNFNYKENGDTQWYTVKLNAVSGIEVRHDSEEANLWEFLFSDWNIMDLHGDYRDRTNINRITLKVIGEADITLAELKQYEQREWFLGQFFHDLQIGILKFFNLYRDLDDVTDEWVETLAKNFNVYGLDTPAS